MNKSFVNSKIYKILHAILHFGLWISIGVSAIYLIVILYQNFSVGNKKWLNSTGLCFDGFILNNEVLTKSVKSSFLFFFTAAMTLSISILCIWILCNIVDSLKDSSPFTMKNVKRIRMIGWVLFAQAYLRQLMNYIFANELYNAYLQNEIQPVLKARFTLIPDGAFLALCILVLAEIFRYGCNLQQEHDTTV